jgi:hypothetical protein
MGWVSLAFGVWSGGGQAVGMVVGHCVELGGGGVALDVSPSHLGMWRMAVGGLWVWLWVTMFCFVVVELLGFSSGYRYGYGFLYL